MLVLILEAVWDVLYSSLLHCTSVQSVGTFPFFLHCGETTCVSYCETCHACTVHVFTLKWKALGVVFLPQQYLYSIRSIHPLQQNEKLVIYGLLLKFNVRLLSIQHYCARSTKLNHGIKQYISTCFFWTLMPCKER